jgi:hypothetical protein
LHIGEERRFEIKFNIYTLGEGSLEAKFGRDVAEKVMVEMLLEKGPLKQSLEICKGNANGGDDGDGKKKKLHNIIT